MRLAVPLRSPGSRSLVRAGMHVVHVRVKSLMLERVTAANQSVWMLYDVRISLVELASLAFVLKNCIKVAFENRF